MKLHIQQSKEELKELDLNPELELLKIKKKELERVQSVVKKEQMQQQIDTNINKIDQDLKRRIRELRRRIQTVNKWKQSNKSRVDFTMGHNQKNIDQADNNIKDLSQKLTERCAQIKEQRRDIEQLHYYSKPENQNELLLEEENNNMEHNMMYDHDGIIIEEGIEEDMSNLAAAKDLLKELDAFDHNSMSPSLGARDISDNLTQRPLPNFNVDSHRSILVQEIINEQSFNFGRGVKSVGGSALNKEGAVLNNNNNHNYNYDRDDIDLIDEDENLAEEEKKVQEIISNIHKNNGD